MGALARIRGPQARAFDHRLGAMVWLVLAFLVFAPPVGYLMVAYTARGSALQTKIDIKAEVVSQEIGRSLHMWMFEEERLGDLLRGARAEADDESIAIVASGGRTVAASKVRIAAPAMVRTAPVFDAGEPVGRLEIRRSMLDLVVSAGLALLAGCALASATLALLRTLQARNVRIAAAMFEEQERARVTLHSIGDAVITTDAQARVDYMNPTAERLTQWRFAEARGLPLADVCVLVDERTLESMPTPVIRTLRDGCFSPSAGEYVALVRRDGSSVAIQESASPLRGHAGAVVGAALVFRDVADTRRMAQRITWAATHDMLTGLVNRREFESRLEASLQGARNSGRRHSVCYLDLDQFKIVNDTCGHAAGDALLKQLAAVLQGKLRESDTLARLGGDEFGVLLEGCGAERASVIGADLLAGVSGHRFNWDGRIFSVGVSIGIAEIGPETAALTDALAAADSACYAAKEQGRNRVCVFHSSDRDIAQRRSEIGWAARLTEALDAERFVLYYQRYLALGDHETGGEHIEILLRLIDEQGNVVLPGSFIPAAERYGLMPAIDRWVIQTAFGRYRDLAAAMGPGLTCAINLSGTTINSVGLLQFIAEQSRLHGLPPGAVCFEITETAAIGDLRSAAVFMRAVKSLGFSFALDDFGTGTSSLAYLKTLPVDYLKIDGSFIRNIVHDPIDRAMAETINRVGHIMGLRTVGEFAESPDVIQELRRIGIDFAQGYGVQMPQPLDDVPVARQPDPESRHAATV